MLDRISLYPGRVTLTPVSGQTNTYDMVRADSPTQEGTPLNKTSLLKDATIAQFGLSSGAVPDDVFTWLGKYNEHWWSLLHGQAYSFYEEKLTKITETVEVARVYFDEAAVEINYSKNITINQSNGSVSLLSPVTLNIRPNADSMEAAAATLAANAPCYFESRESVLYYIPSGATSGYANSTLDTDGFGHSDELSRMYLIGNCAESIRASTVSSQIVQVPAGETTYEHSTDRNAYPDSGTVSGITYSYLGVPFEKFPTMPRIETGSYTGTGTYGASNPNSLTFEFAPKLLIVSYNNMALLWTGGDQGTSLYGNTNNLRFSTSGTTVSWYSTSSASYQNNANGVIYPYVALG